MVKCPLPVTEYKSKMQNVKKASHKAHKEDQEAAANQKKNIKV